MFDSDIKLILLNNVFNTQLAESERVIVTFKPKRRVCQTTFFQVTVNQVQPTILSNSRATKAPCLFYSLKDDVKLTFRPRYSMHWVSTDVAA